MQNRDAGADRHRTEEDEYFRRRDQELVRRQEQQAAVEAARRSMANAIGISNDDLVLDLELAGFDEATIVLLELVPPIQTAWADGSVSKGEREAVLQIAAREHVPEWSSAYMRLIEWLEHRLPHRLFETSLRAIDVKLEALEPETGVSLRRRLIDDCTRVAAASGGLMGWGHAVSDEERQVIDRVARRLR